MSDTEIIEHPVHLGRGATAVVEPEAADGMRRTVSLQPGEYAINEPGIWHTADVSGSATAVFITAGWGTQHRPRVVP